MLTFLVYLLHFFLFFFKICWYIITGYESAFWEYLFSCFFTFFLFFFIYFSDLKKMYLEVKGSDVNFSHKVFHVFILCVVIYLFCVLVYFLNGFLDVAPSYLLNEIGEQEGALIKLKDVIGRDENYLNECRKIENYYRIINSKK